MILFSYFESIKTKMVITTSRKAYKKKDLKWNFSWYQKNKDTIGNTKPINNIGSQRIS